MTAVAMLSYSGDPNDELVRAIPAGPDDGTATLSVPTYNAASADTTTTPTMTLTTTLTPPTTAPPTASSAAPVTVKIDPTRWLEGVSRWSEWGPDYDEDPGLVEEGATHTHAFGKRVGSFVYEFALTRTEAKTAEVAARLSSEFYGSSAPPDGFSDVTLVVNDVSYPSQRVIPDDGSGQNYTWRIDPSVLLRGTNTLAFVVDPGARYHNGLCIYDRSLVPTERDEPIFVRLRQ